MKKNIRKIIYLDGEKVSVSLKNSGKITSYSEGYKLCIKEGLNASYKLMKSRPKSEYEIKQALHKKGFLDSEIKSVIDSLKNQNLINDIRFVRFFLESYQNSKPFGKYVLKKKLIEKGISSETISEEISKYFEENDIVEQALSLIKQRSYKYEGLKKLDKIQKIERYLYSRGYSYDVSQSVLSKLELE